VGSTLKCCLIMAATESRISSQSPDGFEEFDQDRFQALLEKYGQEAG